MTNNKEQLKEQQQVLRDLMAESIYGNAIEAPSSLDICQLFYGQGVATQPFVRQLLDSPSLSLELAVEESWGEELRNLYFESISHSQLHGTQSLSFGYPLYIKRDRSLPKGYIAAPVFIWHLQLNVSQTQPDLYYLVRTFNQTVEPNPFLVYYLDKVMGSAATKALFEAAALNKLNADKLLHACNAIGLEQGWDGLSSAYNVQPIPVNQPLDALLNANTKGGILWSGVLGIFANPQAANLQLLQKVIDNQSAETVLTAAAEPPVLSHPFGLANLSTTQQAVLRALHNHSQVLVDAPAGTGKQEVIISILLNILANKGKSLVVSHQSDLLLSIKKQLDALGLGDLVLILQDSIQDKQVTINRFQTKINAVPTVTPFEKETINLLTASALRKRAALDTQYKALAQPVYNQQSWAEVVGQFLYNQFKEGKHTLTGRLQPQDWQFEAAEHEKAVQQLRLCKRLYAPLNSLEHPLQILHSSIFLHKNASDAFDFVDTTTEQLLIETRRLHHHLMAAVENYEEALANQYNRYYKQWYVSANTFIDDVSDYRQEYGEATNVDGFFGKISLAIKSLFSSRNKSIKSLNTENETRYKQFIQTFQHKPYFNHNFSQTGNLTKITDEMNAFKTALARWRETTEEKIRAEVSGMSSKTINPDVDFRTTIERLEQEFEEMIARINTKDLLAEHLISLGATMPEKANYLQQVILKLETIQRFMRDFDAFHAWQNNWLEQSDSTKKMVTALAQTQPKDWEASFNSWYFYHLLAKQSHQDLPDSDSLLLKYEDDLQKIAALLPKQALHIWQTQQQQQVNRIKKENKNLWLQLSDTKDTTTLNARSLKDFLSIDWTLLTDLYPILLVSPAVAADSMPESRKCFDLAIINNADTQTASANFGTIWRSRSQVVFGEQAAVKMTGGHSLYQYALEHNFYPVELQQFSAPIRETLSQLYNATYYGHRLAILPPDLSELREPVMRLMEVNGIYYPSQRTNEDEANEIIRLLNDISPNAVGTYPSVGIVCFTKEQRSLLQDYIQKIKQQKSAGFELLFDLERNGLAVYHLSELEGVTKDIMLVTTTYGLDVRQNLTTDIDELNKPNATSYIRFLMAAARLQVVICSSIPHDYTKQQVQNLHQPVLRQLALYLSYAEAVEDENHTQVKRLLNTIVPVPTAADFAPAPTLNEQVREELAKYMDGSQIKTNVWVDNIPVDIIIESSAETRPLAVIVDGFFSRGTRNAFSTETELRARLQKRGYEYYALRTEQWWRQPNLEARKLAGMVLQPLAS